jgi:hypothetical protein
MLVANVRASCAQIATGSYPQHDEATRRAVREELLFLARDREEQVALDASYLVGLPRLRIEGLTVGALPPETTLGELRRIQNFVRVGSL